MFSLSLSQFYLKYPFLQIGEWDVSRVQGFNELFVDLSAIPFPGADSFNEPLNWDTGT